MNKFFFGLLLCGLSFQSTALDDEQNLLADWGVSQNENGEIVYQGRQLMTSEYWVSQPMPYPQGIDYSILPFQFKPLILFYQQR